MASILVIPHSIRVGEILTLVCGFGLSTLVVLARLYTKTRITKKWKMEDCKFRQFYVVWSKAANATRSFVPGMGSISPLCSHYYALLT
jgi:hypothetical protein